MKSIARQYLTAGALSLSTPFLPPPVAAQDIYVPAVREMAERRGDRERHYLLANGSYKAEVYTRPIHFRAADGSWQPIDTTLGPSPRLGFAFANVTNTLKTYLSTDGNGWIRVEAPQGAVSFRPLGLATGSATAQGNRLAVTGLDRNISLTYEVQPGQLKETITLAAPVASPTFSYAVMVEGLTPRKDSDGSVVLQDGTGDGGLLISAPWMKDAAGRTSGRVEVAIEQTSDGFVYTMSPDPEWLATARYPVTIDPTIGQVWTAVNLYDGAGTYDNLMWSPGINGDGGEVWTGPYLAAGIGSDYSTAYRSVVSFSPTGVPLGSRIESATLRLLADHASSDANRTVQIFGVNKPLNPIAKPTLRPTPANIGRTATDLRAYLATLSPLEPNFWGAYKYFTVTGIVQKWAHRPITDPDSLNLMIQDTQEDLAPMQRYPCVVYFSAADSVLTFTYSSYTAPPVVSLLPFPDDQNEVPLLGLDASPAVSDLDGDTLPEVVIATDRMLYAEPGPEPLEDTGNQNEVYVFRWVNGYLEQTSGWPKRTRDACLNLAVGVLSGIPKVIAAVWQDNFVPPQFRPSDFPYEHSDYFGSRLYVWNGVATPISPWAPYAFGPPPAVDTGVGLAHGHQSAAPVVFDLMGTGYPQVIQAAQGVFDDWGQGGPWYYKYGSLRIWYGDGPLYSETQTTNPAPTGPWYASDNRGYPDYTNFAVSASPVVAYLTANSGPCVVAATEDGRLYAWRSDGLCVPGWHPTPYAGTQTEAIAGGATPRAPVTGLNSLAAVDFGSGTDDILVATGEYRFYYNFGRVYRFAGSGGPPIASYPSQIGPGFSAGIAVGRLLPSSNEKCVIVGDAMGDITALDSNLNFLWKVTTTHGRAVTAQPVIGDVDNDGDQDVVVGGTDGYVYAFKGDTGALLWRIQTSMSRLEGTDYQDAVFCAPALAKLANNGHLYVVALSYWRYCYYPSGPCPGAGHLMLIDAGPTNTTGNSQYDWPQYQHDAQRTGRAIADN
jgi:hypothetical protein